MLSYKPKGVSEQLAKDTIAEFKEIFPKVQVKYENGMFYFKDGSVIDYSMMRMKIDGTGHSVPVEKKETIKWSRKKKKK